VDAVSGDPSNAVAVLTQEARWSFHFHISDGITRYAPHPAGSWWVIGTRKRAERKAAKELAKYRATICRVRETWEVR
jgi:hypothetical protein